MTAAARRIALKVPDSRWEAVDYPGTAAMVAELRDDGGFVTNVNVVRVDDRVGLPLRDLVQQSIEALPRVLTDFVLLEDDRDRARLVYTFRQGLESLTGIQCHRLVEGEHWVVTATTTSAEYPERADELERIIDSFDLEGGVA